MSSLFAQIRRSSSLGVVSASLAARVATLLILAGAAAMLDQSAYNALVYVLAVSSAAQVLLDPGTANLIIVRWPELSPGGRWELWRSGFRLQLLACVGVAVSTPIVVGAALGSRTYLGLAAAVGILAGAEGLLRYARVTWQAEARFRSFALADAAIAVGRVVALGGLLLGGITGLSVTCVVVAVPVGLAAWFLARPRHRDAVGSRLTLRALVPEVWPYGASTFFSSFYSQMPAVLLGLAGTIQAAAVYSVASRLTQPTELVPGAIASVYLPRLVALGEVARTKVFREQLGRAVTAGGVIAAGLAVLSPVLLPLFGIPFSEGWPTFLLLAAVVPVKFGNYQLVALAIAQGRIRGRLVSSVVIAGASVPLVLVVASRGAGAVALVTLGCELCLALLLTRVSDPFLRRRLVEAG